jgi:Domain of unknown function (DUF4062)
MAGLEIDILHCSGAVAALRDAGCGVPRSVGVVSARCSDDSSSSAEFSERLGHERVGHEHTRKPGVTASPAGDSAQDRAAVILTPDQRVRVFMSSTLEELAEERAAARRAIRRLHLVPLWSESGARPHPPQSMYRAYLEQSQIFVGIFRQRYGWVGPGSGYTP